MKNNWCLLLVLVISGCSSGYGVKYDSVPRGATVVCGGQYKGETPLRLNYKREEGSTALNTVPCKAVWSSGVTKAYQSYFSFSAFPDGVVTTVERPYDSTYSQDSQYEQQQQQQQQQQQKKSVQCSRIGDLSLYKNIQTFKGTLCPIGWVKA
ncbi:MAG: hypothetical protein ACTH6D_12145 [Vibrio litoralis]